MNQLHIPKEFPPEHIWLTADSLTDALDGLQQLRMAWSRSYHTSKSDERDEI